MATRGAVACGHPETAGAAAAVLKDGGNAFDAALAALCTACVVEPALASFGGGGFLLASPVDAPVERSPRVYDFFTQTPIARQPGKSLDFRPVEADFGDTRQEFHIGLGAVATPGIVRGLFDIHRDLATMDLGDIMAPATRAAREGVTVTSITAKLLGVVSAILGDGEDTLALFGSAARPGALAAEGEVIVQPALADLLETLAIEGDDLFYLGEVATQVTADCAGRGGHLQRVDFAEYRAIPRRPLRRRVLNHDILLNPPPSSGGILIAFGLEMIRRLGLTGSSPTDPDVFAAVVRAMMATDQVRSRERLHALDPAEVEARLLDPALLAAYHGFVAGAPMAVRGTTHISVVDGAGNAAAVSLSNGAGSGYVAAGTGIHFNNMLGEQDLSPMGFQHWPLNRRMSSMMSPTLIRDQTGTTTVLGSGGSNRIRTAVLQVLINLMVHRMSIEDAVAAPRAHVEGDHLSVEPGYPEVALSRLSEALGAIERFAEPNVFFGGVHVARAQPGAAGSRAQSHCDGAGDPRRGGVVEVE